MNSLVSIIIPTYGGGQFLDNAIESVLSQTYTNIEIVVVDDNGIGTDNQQITAQHMQKYLKLPNVRYVCHETNKNGSAARNTGVRSSHGEYIALLDDDDIYYPQKIELQVKALQQAKEDVALVYCGVAIFEAGKIVAEREAAETKEWLFDLLTHKVTIGSSSLLIKRSAWDELNGFDESFRRHQDYEFTARVAARYNIATVDYIGFQYNKEFRNSPKSAKKVKEFREHYLEKMMPYISTLPKRQQRIVLVRNRVDVAIQSLKEKDFSGFLKNYFAAKPGWIGVSMLIERTFLQARWRLKHKR